MAGPDSIDKKFRDSYRNDERTLQPQTGGVTPIRNVQTLNAYDPDKRRGGMAERAANTLGEAMQSQGHIMQETGQQHQANGMRSVVTEKYQNVGMQAARVGKSMQLAARRVRGRKKLTAAGVAHRSVGRGVTLSIWSWGFWVWLWFQLPFAILSIIFMAMAQVLHELYLSIQATADDEGMVSAVINGGLDVVEFMVKVLNEFTKLFGFDFNTLNPANFFMVTHTIVMFIGWGTLLAIGIIYTMTGQKAFSGRGAGGKNAMFLLALVGYTIPVLNLFPWFFLWTLMMLKNPR